MGAKKRRKNTYKKSVKRKISKASSTAERITDFSVGGYGPIIVVPKKKNESSPRVSGGTFTLQTYF